MEVELALLTDNEGDTKVGLDCAVRGLSRGEREGTRRHRVRSEELIPLQNFYT